MDLISLLNSGHHLELKSEEEVVNELQENHDIVDNHSDPLSLEQKVKCGRVLISADGAYSVECDACNDRFDGMDSLRTHMKTAHSDYGIRKNGWINVAVTEGLTFKTEENDDQADTIDRIAPEKTVCRLSENSNSKKLLTNISKNITTNKNREEVKIPRYRICSDNPRKPVKITAEPIYDGKRLFCVTCDRQLASRLAFTRHKNYHKERLRKQGITHLNQGGQEDASNETTVKDELDIGDYEIQSSVYDGESKEKLYHDGNRMKNCNPSWDNSVLTITDVTKESTNVVIGKSVFANPDEGTLSKDSNRQNETESEQRLNLDTKFNNSKSRDSFKGELMDFQCRFCNKHFENLTERCLHEESHVNEKAPYRCSICSKSFTKNFNRKNHELIHKGDRPFHCLDCGKTFSTEYYLKRHVQRSMAKGCEPESYSSGTSCKRMKLKANLSVGADAQSPSQREVAIASSVQVESATRNEKTSFCEESNLQKEGIEEGQRKHRTVFTLEPKFDEERNFCITCDLQLGSQQAFINHKKKHRSSIRRWKTRNGLRLRRKHGKTVFSENPDFDDEKQFCITCNREFPTTISFKYHKRIHRMKIHEKRGRTRTLSCELCSERYHSDFTLREHIVTRHGDEIPASLKDDPTYLKCRFCHKQFPKPTERFQHEKSHANERKKFWCTLCPKSFTRSSDRKVHESIHRGERPYRCEQCPKSFRNRNNFTRHVKDVHGGVNGNIKQTKMVVFSENPEFDDEKNFCITCNREFASRSSYNKHKFLHRNLIHPKHPTFFCELCPGKFKSDSGLRDHIVTNHGDEIPKSLQDDPIYLKCRFCHKEFAKPTERYQHEKSHSKEKKPYQCPLCPKSFAKNSERKSHESIHREDLPYRCEQCFKSFRFKTSFRRHVKYNHLRKKPANVVAVEVEGTIKNEEMEPPKTVFSENPDFDDKKHFCITCNREFSSITSFNKHKLLHRRLIRAKQLPVSCELCLERFRSDFGLRDHIVVQHGDEIPKSLEDDPTYLKCRFCHMQFAKPTERYQHEKSHPKERKPYRCPLCPKSFTRNSERIIHESTHREDQPYRCEQCPQSFRNQTYLRRHVKNKHVGIKPTKMAPVQVEDTSKNEKMRRIRKIVFSENPNFDDEKNLCITCNLDFASSISLSTHKLLHQSMILRKQATLGEHVEICHGEEVGKPQQGDPVNSQG
ncbi:zinc finger protein 91-like isoform X2 [Hermetia illucens]|uniref:zinc finger protein 91-like isoform X2 n=1 Tax=Hermetia illucens TaxID=343691 RepID=UPI0018CC6867|nr:zinc finger protein 91-like isoform X2 [Hermetia illucens]